MILNFGPKLFGQFFPQFLDKFKFKNIGYKKIFLLRNSVFDFKSFKIRTCNTYLQTKNFTKLYFVRRLQPKLIH
jgi:hypothetical protein